MLPSMYSGISGLKANQKKLDVIGNNIANSSTTAYKSQRIRFQDMVSQSLSEALGPATNNGGINGKQIGLGVQIAGIDTNTTTGNMQPTSRNLDAAIDGPGYFIVAKGRLDTDSATTRIALNEETHGFSLEDNGGEDGATLSSMFTRDGSFTLDSQGNLLTSDGYRVLGYQIGEGLITYSNDPNIQVTIPFVDANDTEAVIADGTGLVPLAIPDSVDKNGQLVRVQSFSIEKDGVIKAVLADGSVTALGQVAMASFKNDAGLKKMGKNLYQNSANSGEPVVRAGIGSENDNSDGYGDMLQGMLEMSNVDLAEQFTDMIVASRAFQANGKIITTGDEILQDLVNLKR